MLRTYRKHSPRVGRRAFVHDCAQVIGNVVLKDGSSVWPYCVLRGDIERIVIGEDSNIQDLTVIHTTKGSPSLIGRRVTVGHRAVLHGARVGEGSLVGMGAVIMEAVIGAHSLVAAGSLVLAGTRIPPGSLVMGSPAKVRRKLTPGEKRGLEKGVGSYLRQAKFHLIESKAVLA